MSKNPTNTARQVIMSAKREAKRLKHNFISSEMLLFGLVSLFPTESTARILESMGIKYQNVQDEIDKIVDQGSDLVTDAYNYTPCAKEVIALAQQKAQELEDNSLDTKHILLGIIYLDKKCIANRVLENLGAEIYRIPKEINKNYKNSLSFHFFSHFTQKSTKALLFASQEACNLGQVNVTLEMIFLGILKDKKSDIARLMRSIGVTLENAVITIEKKLTSTTFSSKKFNDLKNLFNHLKSDLDKIINEKINSETLDTRLILQNKEIEIKKQITSIWKNNPQIWNILENSLVKEPWDISFSQESIEALKFAVEAFERLNSRYITPEHILLGLLDTEVVRFADFLEELDINPTLLQRKIENYINNGEIAASNKEFSSGYEKFDSLVTELVRDLLQKNPNVLEEMEELHPVLESLCCFLGSRTQEGAYKEDDSVSEAIFQKDVLRFLRSRLGEDVNEHTALSGGFIDIGYHGVIIELKVEKTNGDREHICKTYTQQSTQYAGSKSRQVSIVLVLDLTSKENPIGDNRNDIHLVDVSTHGSNDSIQKYPSKAFVFILNGNIKVPSSYSKKTKKSTGKQT